MARGRNARPEPTDKNRFQKPARKDKINSMITWKDLRARMSASPFVPFRICMTDGKVYDIANHDGMLVGQNSVYVGVPSEPDGPAEHVVQCAILHIARIESRDLPVA